MDILQAIEWIKLGNMAARPEWQKDDVLRDFTWIPKALLLEDDKLLLQNNDGLTEYRFSLDDVVATDWIRI